MDSKMQDWVVALIYLTKWLKQNAFDLDARNYQAYGVPNFAATITQEMIDSVPSFAAINLTVADVQEMAAFVAANKAVKDAHTDTIIRAADYQ